MAFESSSTSCGCWWSTMMLLHL